MRSCPCLVVRHLGQERCRCREDRAAPPARRRGRHPEKTAGNAARLPRGGIPIRGRLLKLPPHRRSSARNKRGRGGRGRGRGRRGARSPRNVPPPLHPLLSPHTHRGRIRPSRHSRDNGSRRTTSTTSTTSSTTSSTVTGVRILERGRQRGSRGSMGAHGSQVLAEGIDGLGAAKIEMEPRRGKR